MRREIVVASFLAVVATGLVTHLALAQERRVLAGPDAVTPEGLSSINGLRQMSDGRLLVSDRLGKAVLVVDLDAGTIDTIGRVGQGPGEYEMPGELFAMAGDWSLLMDFANMRLTKIGPDGSFGESISIRQGDLFIRPNGVDDAGRIYFDLAGSVQFRPGEDPTRASRQAPLVRWDPEAGTFDTLTSIQGPDLSSVTPIRVSGGGTFHAAGAAAGFARPYQWMDAWTVAPDGTVYLARSEPFGLDRVDANRLHVGPEIPYDPVRVTRADQKAWADAQASQQMVMMVAGQGSRTMQRDRPDIDQVDWPDVKPPFPRDAVHATPSGEVWVQRYVKAGAPDEYSVFDSNGALVRTVTLPANRQLVGFGHVVVYLSHADEFDLQWLERYRY